MGWFYFDESIHERGGFIIGAFVYSEHDLSPVVRDALAALGLKPGIDEFKSSSKMLQEPIQSTLRSHLKRFFWDTRLGLVVVPYSERAILGNAALTGLKKILTANGLESVRNQVFFDEGVMFSGQRNLIADLALDVSCDFFFEQDSRQIGGIQIADLTAHTFSVTLLEELGLISKKVKAGENSGYDPDLDIELGFELWAGVRYHFFTQDQVDMNQNQLDGFTLDTGTYALYVSPSCPPTLTSAAQRRFGTTYVGCIH
jgi:hypothetical protein